MKTLWTVLLAVVLMFAQVIIGSTLPSLFLDRTDPLLQPLGALGVTLAALALVWAVRRFVYRRPWSALGWRRPWHMLIGVAAGALPVLAALATAVVVGAGTWMPMDASPLLKALPLAAVVLLLGALMATSLGFAAGAARVRGGGLWMAAGVHWGFHLALRSAPVQPESFGIVLVLMAVGLTLAGAVLLRGQGVLRPDRRQADLSSRSCV
ncbi:hypothetical protein ACBR40_07660 [Nonomuraea sp. AD125B]|uniref:hypothetical protein n=1 Tax=Nonomuraea sp. AD125B TaxID=3242897 RepID=UPI003527661F